MSTKKTPIRRRRASDRPQRPVTKVKVTPEERRRLFAAHFLLTRNVTASALAAGLAPKSAPQTGNRMLKHPQVRALIKEGDAKDRRTVQRVVAKLEVTRDTIMAELAKMGFSNALDFGQVDDEGGFRLDLTRTTRDQMAAVRELVTHERVIDGKVLDRRTTLKLAPKREALHTLALLRGDLRDDGAPPATVNFNIYGLYEEKPHERPDPKPVQGAHEFKDPARR